MIKVTQGTTFWAYQYDYLGRRISKSGNTIATRRYVYDGWNLIAELDGSAAVLRTFAWGLDASGTLQGAGGIGGLLAISDGANTYYPIYSASNNVIGLYNQTGAIVAAYDYDVFGNQTAAAGLYAAANPFRCSTKFTDAETQFVYYGMRYYHPQLGRFINRDPSGETGGLNLYGFVRNNPVENLDAIGLDAIEVTRDSETQEELRIADLERRTREATARAAGMERAGGNVTNYIGNELPSVIAEGYADVGSSQKKNTGAYTQNKPLEKTDARYKNHGDPTARKNSSNRSEDVKYKIFILNEDGTLTLIAGSEDALNRNAPTEVEESSVLPDQAPSSPAAVSAAKNLVAQLRDLRLPNGELSENAKRIRSIEANSYSHRIYATTKILGNAYAFLVSNARDGTGTGGYVVINPEETFALAVRDPRDKTKVLYDADVISTPLTRMSHEYAGHVYGFNVAGAGSGPVGEFEAVRIENEIRSLQGTPLRTHYSQKPVPEYDKYVPKP